MLLLAGPLCAELASPGVPVGCFVLDGEDVKTSGDIFFKSEVEVFNIVWSVLNAARALKRFWMVTLGMVSRFKVESVRVIIGMEIGRDGSGFDAPHSGFDEGLSPSEELLPLLFLDFFFPGGFPVPGFDKSADSERSDISDEEFRN